MNPSAKPKCARKITALIEECRGLRWWSKFSPFSCCLAALVFFALPSRAFSQNHKSALHTVKLAEMNGVEYVGLEDLAAYLNLRTFYSEKTRKTILYVGDAEIKVTAMNPFVQIDDRMAQLPVETRAANDELLVPLHAFAELLRPLYRGAWPERLRKRGAALDTTASSLVRQTNITKIAVEGKTNGTLIRIQATQPFARKHISARFSRGWMYVDIVGGRVAANALTSIQGTSLVKEVRPVQTGMVTQLSFRLQQEIDASQVSISNQGSTILVSLPTQEVVPEAVLRTLERDRQKWRIDTIVLDPGHGGRDPGAIGPEGTREKDVTLQVALRLKKLMEKDLGLRVVLTRETDAFIKLDERTTLANNAEGKMFISLHCNANKSRRVDGTTTYFLGPAKTDEALEVALLENSVVKYENESGTAHSDEAFILTAMAQNAFHHESEGFAQIIQEEMQTLVGLPDRGVEQAGFRVLVGASMPSVLVEMAFISNRKEEKLLDSGETQQKIARALMHSVKRFKEKYEQGS